jgi:hypothetical protein
MKIQTNSIKVMVRDLCPVPYSTKNNNSLLALMFCNDFLVDNIYDLFKLWLQRPMTDPTSYFIPCGEDFAFDLYTLFTAYSVTWQGSVAIIMSLILAAIFSVLCALPYLISPAIWIGLVLMQLKVDFSGQYSLRFMFYDKIEAFRHACKIIGIGIFALALSIIALGLWAGASTIISAPALFEGGFINYLDPGIIGQYAEVSHSTNRVTASIITGTGELTTIEKAPAEVTGPKATTTSTETVAVPASSYRRSDSIPLSVVKTIDKNVSAFNRAQTVTLAPHISPPDPIRREIPFGFALYTTALIAQFGLCFVKTYGIGTAMAKAGLGMNLIAMGKAQYSMFTSMESHGTVNGYTVGTFLSSKPMILHYQLEYSHNHHRNFLRFGASPCRSNFNAHFFPGNIFRPSTLGGALDFSYSGFDEIKQLWGRWYKMDCATGKILRSATLPNMSNIYPDIIRILAGV